MRLNKTSIQLLLALAISPITIFAQGGSFTIQGETGGDGYNGRFVKLYYDQDTVEMVDSARIVDGRFGFAGSVELPVTGILSMGGEDDVDRIELFLSPGTIRVSAADSFANARISGTKLAEDHDRLARMYRPIEQKVYAGLKQFMTLTDEAEKREFFKGVSADIDEYTQVKRQAIHTFVRENPDSYVSLYHLDKSAAGRMTNYETTYPHYEQLSERLQNTPLGKQLGERLLAAKSAFTGEVYQDFVSTTPDGQKLNLKEIVEGHKYVLLDFWASWCGPCRKENPHVVEAYNSFKDQGFTVLSVSLDNDAEKWKAAIEEDGMPWYHASSLQGWKEPAGALYGVRAIPQNFLINQDGTIVAVNLRGATLARKVGELLD